MPGCSETIILENATKAWKQSWIAVDLGALNHKTVTKVNKWSNYLAEVICIKPSLQTA
jgi:hypothetical protein